MIKSFFKKIILRTDFGLFLSAAILFSVVSILSNDFLTEYNLFNVGRNLSLFFFVGLSQAVVLTIGHMNLSVGAIGGLTTITAGYLLEVIGLNIWLAIIIALFVGILCGAINGLLIAKVGLNSFIVTLTTMFIFTGVNYGFTQGYSFNEIPKAITVVGRGSLYGIPLLFIVMVIALLIIFFIYKYTLIGRRSLAIGQNLEAAKYSGTNIESMIIFNHILSGFIASIAALLFLTKNGSASAATGKDWLILSFAVAIIGGTALKGGSLSAFGLLMGAAIMIMIKNALVLLQLNVYYQQAFLGLLILIAIGIDRARTVINQGKLA